jgi:hypothetical protein
MSNCRYVCDDNITCTALFEPVCEELAAANCDITCSSASPQDLNQCPLCVTHCQAPVPNCGWHHYMDTSSCAGTNCVFQCDSEPACLFDTDVILSSSAASEQANVGSSNISSKDNTLIWIMLAVSIVVLLIGLGVGITAIVIVRKRRDKV